MRSIVITALLLSTCCFSLAGDPPRKSTDPDTAYKENCMRCHSAVQGYSPRQTATIVMHMRVRANLSESEAQAILQYLSGNNLEPSTPPEPSKVQSSSAH